MTRAATGTVRKLPSGRYQARMTFPDGVRRSAPSTFLTKRDAAAWVAQQVADVSRGTWKPQSHAGSVSRSFGEYAEKWLVKHRVGGAPLADKTAENYRSLIRRFLLPAFGNRPLHLITREEVTRWYEGVAPHSPSTRMRAWAVLSGIMREALEDELIDASPVVFTKVRAYKRVHDPVVLELPELDVLTAHMPPQWKSLVQVSFWSGIRWGEATELRRKDIEVQGPDKVLIRVRRAVVHTTEKGAAIKTPKNGNGRDVPLRGVGARWLIERLASPDLLAGPDALLWPAPSDPTRHMRNATVRRSFIPAREAAGRPTLHWHDLRHSAGTHMARQGATLAELMKFLGHNTVSAALVYQSAAQSRLELLADRMAAQAEGYAQGVADASRLAVDTAVSTR